MVNDRRSSTACSAPPRTAQKPLAAKKGMIRHLPFFFGKEHGFRSLPALARKSFRDLWPKLYQKVDHPRYRVALFGGCLVDFVYPEQAVAFLKALKGRGCRWSIPWGRPAADCPPR